MANRNYALNPWVAEFVHPGVEQEYRSEQFRQQRCQVLVALLVWAGLWLLFVLDDYGRIGPQPEFGVMLVQRLLVFGAILAFVVAIPRWPALFTESHGLAALMAIGWTGYLSLYFLLPGDEIAWIFGMGMVMLVALFVFLPIRIPHALGVSLYSIAGTAAALYLSHGVHGVRLASVVGAMMVPVVTGLVVLYRLQTIHRKQFGSLKVAQEMNLELAHEIAVRRELEETLRQQASIDPLTGLYNRRQYEELIEHEMRRARRAGTPLALCILDIDHFKRVNDTYGHGVGDEALQFLAALCRETVRETDIVGRLGGEEFVVALPDTALDDALLFSERLRTRLEQAEIETESGVIRLTVTIGVAELSSQDASLKDFARRADQAMYAGKRAGRNQVQAAA